MTSIALALPAGFALAQVQIGRAGDRHECGREAARRALAAIGVAPARLAYDGTRPVVAMVADHDVHNANVGLDASVDHDARADDTPVAEHVAVSITHGRRVALAVAARVARLGIDLCDDDPRLPALAHRFLVDELEVAKTPLDLTACFAAKEAALKALGLGVVDGGVLDGTAVRVVSLAPPRLSHDGLHLALSRFGGGALAVVYG